MRLHGRNARPPVTFAVLAMAVACFAMLQSLVVPVLTSFEREYDADKSTVTWMLTGYLLSAAIATPLLGRLGDVVGKTRMLAVTLAALSLGSLAAAIAPDIGWLIGARVFQGLGGGVLPLAFGVARDEFEDRVSTTLSVLAAIAAAGFGVGIVVAGEIVEHLGLAGLFLAPAVLAALVSAAVMMLIPASPVRSADTRLPLLPGLLLAVWLVALLLALSRGSQWGWGSPPVLGLLTVAFVVAAAWITTELRVPVPMIDMQMMRIRGVWSANAVTVFLGFGMFASLGFLPQFLQTPPVAGYGFGATITTSGRFLLPTAVASFLIGFWTAPLCQRFGARAVVAAGSLVAATSYAAIAFWHSEAWQILVWTTGQGLGSGLVLSSLTGVVVASVAAEQTGVASGMNANFRTIGGALGSAVMAGIVTEGPGSGGYPAEEGYAIGFLVLAGAALAAFVCAFAVPRSPEHSSDADDVPAAGPDVGYVPVSPPDHSR